jgi:Spy/CpxP family protein refolding chaperone
MKRHFAVFVLLGSIVSGTSLFAQQRSGGPAPGTVQAPALSPAQQDDTLRQAQDLLQRMRNTPNMPESERTNMLRELERAMAQLQRAQETVSRLRIVSPGRGQTLPLVANPPVTLENLVIAGDALNGGPLIARRVARADGGTNAWWTNANLLARLGLSDDQKTRIERAFEASKQNLTTSRDQLEKEEAQLSKLLAADLLDRGSIVTQINRVIQARGEMERVNSLMTLEMRGVLTSAQWSQLQVQNPNAVIIVNPVPPGGTAVPGFGIRGGGAGLGMGQRGPRGGPTPVAPPNP